MPVYAIQAGENGPIKFGHAVDPIVRLAALQKVCTAKLAILAVDAEGDWLTEADLHWRFRHWRLPGGPRNEWFEADAGVREYVARFAATGRAPGAWYLPLHIKPQGRWPIALPGDVVAAKFGLTRARLRKIAPDHTAVAAVSRNKLLIPAIPMIRDVLRLDGLACCAADFFPTAPGHA